MLNVFRRTGSDPAAGGVGGGAEGGRGAADQTERTEPRGAVPEPHTTAAGERFIYSYT